MPRPAVRLPVIAVLALALAPVLSSCTTTETKPPALVTIAGNWQLDAAASEDFDGKLEHVLETERKRMRARHGPVGARAVGPGGAVEGAESADPDALVMAAEDPAKVRARLADELRPPASLRISVADEAVEIWRDAEPVRHFQPGQVVSRIDSSGAASVSSGWKQSAFVIHARYTNKSARDWHFEVDPASDILYLNFTANDAEFGNFMLRTGYHRATKSD